MTGTWRPPYLTDHAIARGGGSGGGEQRTVQTTQLPPFIEQAGEQALARATDVSNRPYEANPYATVVPQSADTTAAYDTVRNLQGATDPAYQAAQGAITGGGLLGSVAPITTGQVNTDTAALMNPYLTAVVDPTVTQMRQGLAQSLGRERANASNVGAFGGSRLGVQEGTAQSQEALGEGQLVGGLLSGGYSQAQQAAQALEARNQAAGQWATTTLPALASGQFGQDITGAGLLEQVGRAEQGQSQAELDQQAANWETQWNYPTEALSVLESVLGTTPHGSTTTTVGPPPTTNQAGNIIGGIGTAASIAGTVATIM
jgi:hypothetical protein